MLFAAVLVALIATLAGCELATRTPPGNAMADTMLPGLPEHGLAARYPGDHGIARDPAVVFSDDVESAVPGALPLGWDRPVGAVRVMDDGQAAHSGHRALEFRIDGPAAIGMEKQFSPGFDRLFLRYYLKFDNAFPGAHHVGGLLFARAPGVPDTAPGIKPDGTNKFDVALDHWPSASIPPPGYQTVYVYHMDQQHEWGEHFAPSGKTSPGINAARGIFGPSFVPREDFVPARGAWHCYELMVQANTPGHRNGRVAFWFDGRLAADFPNLRFRTTDHLTINYAQIAMYESQTRGLQRIWIDDVVVATSYIGPMTAQ